MKKILTIVMALLITNSLVAGNKTLKSFASIVDTAARMTAPMKCSANKVTVCSTPGSVSTYLDSLKKLQPDTYIVIHKGTLAEWQVEVTTRGKKQSSTDLSVKKITVLEEDIMVLNSRYPGLKYAFILE